MPTWIKVLVIVLASVFAVLFAAGFLADDWVGNTLKDKISKSSDGKLKLDFSDIQVDLLRQSAYLFKANLRSTQSDSVEVEFSRLALTDVDVTSLLFSNRLEFDSLDLDDVDVKLKLSQKEAKSAPFSIDKLNIAAEVKKSFDKVQAEHLHITNLKVAAVQANTMQFSAVIDTFLVNSIEIDSGNFLTKNRTLFAEDWKFKIDSLNYKNARTSIAVPNARITLHEGTMTASLPEADIITSGGRYLVQQATLDRIYLSSWINRELKGQRISLKNVEAILPVSADSASANKSQSGQKSLTQFTLHSFIPEEIKLIALEKLDIENFEIQQGNRLYAQGGVQVNNIDITDAPAFSSNKFLHSGAIALRLDSLKLANGHAGEVKFTSTGSKAQLLASDLNYSTSNLETYIYDLSLEGIKVLPSEEKVAITSIKVGKPDIDMRLTKQSDKKQSEPGLNLYPLIEPYLQGIEVEEIRVAEGNVYIKTPTARATTYQLQGINLAVNNIDINKGSAFSEEKILHAASYTISVDKLISSPEESRYNTIVKSLVLNTNKKSVGIEKIELEAKKTQFPYQSSPSDQYDLTIANLLLDGMDFNQASRDNVYTAEKLRVDKIDLTASKDKRIEDNEQKPMPQEWFSRAGIPFSLDKVQVNRATITYRETHQGSEKAGVIHFTDLKLKGANFSNIAAYNRRHPIANLTGLGFVQSQGKFTTEVKIHMLSDSLRVDVVGQMDSMNLKEVNEIAQYTGIGLIKQGHLIGANWNFTANKNYSQGEMQFLYKNLKVQINTGDKADTSGIFQDAMSGLVNLLLVEGEVLPNTEDAQPRKIGARRNSNKGFFSYYWSTLFNGIKEFVGIPHKDPDKLAN